MYDSSSSVLFVVRLVGGSSYNEGRVEVYYNGRWGTVCNDGWDELDAKTVCRQLGYESSEIADFGKGRKEAILLDNVMCSSNDIILTNCGHYGVSIKVKCNYNSYYTVAGVKCFGEYSQEDCCVYHILGYYWGETFHELA